MILGKCPLLKLTGEKAVGEGLANNLTLHAELLWKKGGLKYLGVYLGDDNFSFKKMEVDFT